jgi:VPDSG-CTERM motif
MIRRGDGELIAMKLLPPIITIAVSLIAANATPITYSQVWSVQYMTSYAPSDYSEVAQIHLDYYGGFETINPTNGSIHSMLLRMDNPLKTFAFASDGLILADVFHFSYQPLVGTFSFGNIYSLERGGLFPYDIIEGKAFGTPGQYNLLAPVDRVVLRNVPTSQPLASVPDGGSTAALMFVGLLGLCGLRKWHGWTKSKSRG